MSFTAPRRTLRRHRLAQAGTLGAALTLVLTACGGDPEPTETTTAPPATPSASQSTEAASPSPNAGESASTGSTTPTATPSTGATTSPAAGSTSSGAYVPASAEGPAQNVPKPEMPAAMKEETEEGAEAAVEYFWDALHYAERTGDTTLLDETYSEYCEFCIASSKTMNSIYESGGWSTGESTEIESIIARRSEHGYILTLVRNSSAVEIYSESGAVNEDASGGSSENEPWIAEAAYLEDRGQWVIDEMTSQRESRD